MWYVYGPTCTGASTGEGLSFLEGISKLTTRRCFFGSSGGFKVSGVTDLATGGAGTFSLSSCLIDVTLRIDLSFG